MPIVLGRGFTDRDNETAPKVGVINDAAARKYFADTNPIGQRFGDSVETSGQIEIVGVLRDAKYNSVRDDAPPTLYVPYSAARNRGHVVRRADGRRSAERGRIDSRSGQTGRSERSAC